MIVDPPMIGGRRVIVEGRDVGRAHRLPDLLELLSRVGLDAPDLADPAFVGRRGGVPDTWPA
ncbi:hypothetical protein NGB36_24555 [Streptomyces sp. RB6PN25]|uniref:Uncharacterized protein n=1 Tax=Streptomyces humicola TaxID=2953240 RepID=A0ABT1Q1A7_9ACTN|nr:hypothetical protein [Streptomyces humicola]MCQ4083679.1 hypothetical protein [Streptomyces humicola]